MSDITTEIWFYHLQSRGLRDVLPLLLEKSLQRDWTVVVQGTDPTKLAELDQWLWCYEAESFLPHGCRGDGEDGADQPIWLTTDNTTPNGAPIRFMIDGADCLALMATPAFAAHQRIVVLFDGRDEAALGFARAQWKALKDSNAQLSYFQQNDDGRWDKKA